MPSPPSCHPCPWYLCEKGDLTSVGGLCLFENGLNLMSSKTYYVLGVLCPVCKIQLRFSIRLSEPSRAPEGMRAHMGLCQTGRGGGGWEVGRGCPQERHSWIPASCWLSKTHSQTTNCLQPPPGLGYKAWPLADTALGLAKLAGAQGTKAGRAQGPAGPSSILVTSMCTDTCTVPTLVAKQPGTSATDTPRACRLLISEKAATPLVFSLVLNDKEQTT